MKIPDSPHLGLDTAHNDQRVITTFHHRQNAATRLADSIAVHWFDGSAVCAVHVLEWIWTVDN